MSKKAKQAQAAQQRFFIKEVCSIDTSNLDEKKKISPINNVTGLDERTYDINGEQQLQRLKDTGLKIVLNVAHGLSQKYGDDAAGWFDEFELKADGIYAKLELNELGKELIESKKYKYLSPEYFAVYNSATETLEVHLIIGVGLVNQPNLLNQALNQIHQNFNPTQTTEEPPMSEELQKQVNTLQQEKTDLTTQVNNLDTKNKELVKQLNEQRINNAVVQGELAPAKKDFALTLEGNQLDAYLESEKQSFKGTENNNLNPDQDDEGDDSADCPILSQLSLGDA